MDSSTFVEERVKDGPGNNFSRGLVQPKKNLCQSLSAFLEILVDLGEPLGGRPLAVVTAPLAANK